MAFPDVRTVLFIMFLTNAVCVFVLAFLWLQNRKRFAGTHYWLLDLLFQTAATLFVATRGMIPDWLSIGFGDVMAISGALFGYIGITQFLGRRKPHWYNYILLAILVFFHMYFAFIQPSLEVRNFVLSASIIAYSVPIMLIMVRPVEQGTYRMAPWIGWVFASFTAVSGVRIIIILSGPATSNDFFQSGTYDMLILIVYQLLLILLTFGLFLMVNQRLLKNLQFQEEKYSKAFQSSPYAMTLTRASDGRLLELNDGFKTLTGYTQEELVGKTTFDLQFWARPEDRSIVLDQLAKSGHIYQQELQFRLKSGELITGLFSADTILINGEPCILSSIDNITDRKENKRKVAEYSEHLEDMVTQRTRELRDAQEKLVRNERLATIGQLAGGVGHELRNPLAAISNSIYYINMVKPDVDEKVNKSLEIIDRQTQISLKIINDLLDFARVKEGERESVSISDIVHETLDRFPAPVTIAIELDISDDFPRAYIDPRQMVQVLGNLVANAYDAMPEGGTLQIRASQENEMIKITVRDTGVGISPENLQKLFEPLFTTKKKGIGLGLLISQKLVEANGGSIKIESELGQGTSFHVFLPMMKGN